MAMGDPKAKVWVAIRGSSFYNKRLRRWNVGEYEIFHLLWRRKN